MHKEMGNQKGAYGLIRTVNYLTISIFFLLIFLLFQVVVFDAGMDASGSTNKVAMAEVGGKLPKPSITAKKQTEEQSCSANPES